MRRPHREGSAPLAGMTASVALLLALGLAAQAASPTDTAAPVVEVIGVTVEPGASASVLTMRCSRQVWVQPLQHRSATLVTLDLAQTRRGRIPEELPVHAGGIETIRSGLLADGALRVELHLQPEWAARVNSNTRTDTVTFSLTRLPPPPKPQIAQAPKPPAARSAAKPAGAQITLVPLADTASREDAALKLLPPPPAAATAGRKVWLSTRSIGGELIISIPVGSEVEARWAALPGDNPRFFVDLIPTAPLEVVVPELPASSLARGIRSGKPEAGQPTVRVVLDLAGNAAVRYFRADDGRIDLTVYEGRLVGQARPQPNWRSNHLIAVDAGHGGRDPGARGHNGVLEKTVALDVAKRLRDLLVGRGYRVAVSRGDDRSLAPNERAAWVSQTRPRLLVSLHCDAIERTGWYGVTTYFRAGEAEDRRFAERVQEQLVRTVDTRDLGARADTTLYRGGLYILRVPSVTAALIELGYVTHEQTARQLATPAYRALLAKGIAAGIDQHLQP